MDGLELHYHAVSPPLLKLLRQLMQEKLLASFQLVGGTALALRLGHRVSVDIDLFSDQAFDVQAVSEMLRDRFLIQSLEMAKNTVCGEVGGIKINIMAHRYPMIGTVCEVDNIRLSSLEDIAAMKLNAISNRGCKKDFWDYAELLKSFSREEMLSFFAKKYSDENIWYVEKSLGYFSDADEEPDPRDLNGRTWEEVKKSVLESNRLPIDSSVLEVDSVLLKMQQVEDLYRSATHCRDCFKLEELETPTIDLAQPRWIGSSYWDSPKRIVILMLNPGSGDDRKDDADKRGMEILRGFSVGSKTLSDVFNHQRVDMPRWGLGGKFLSFYTNNLGLNLDEIAFGNIAWCATQGNEYPLGMLNRCFSNYTKELLKILSPDVLILSGIKTHRFEKEIVRIFPRIKIIPMLHYAHRKGVATSAREFDKVQTELEKAKRRR